MEARTARATSAMLNAPCPGQGKCVEQETMKDYRKFYIDGKWVDPAESHDFTVINPANEEPVATISFGSAADIGRAVAAAKRAFEAYSEVSVEQRLALLRRIIDVYKSKLEEM